MTFYSLFLSLDTFKDFNDTYEKIAEMFENEAANIVKMQEQEVDKLLGKIREELDIRQTLLMQRHNIGHGLSQTFNSTAEKL